MRRFAAGIAAAAFLAAASVATGGMFAALFVKRAAPAPAPAAAPLTIVFSGATPAQGSTQSATTAVVQCTSAYTGGEHSVAMNFDGSLVAWWRGESNVVDYIGTNNGTWSGTPAYSSGKYGNAMSFSGSSYVDAGNPSNLSFTNTSFSISAWAKGNPQTTGVSCIIAKGYNYYCYNYGDAHYGFRIYDGTNIGTQTLTDVFDNRWHHFVVVIDRANGQMKGYVDGASNGETTNISNFGNLLGSANNVTTGGGSGSFFNGSIDDVQIYNRALSAGEVLALYNANATQYTNTFTGLTNGVHTLRAYAQTTSGSITNTGLRTFTVAP
jgi:hypothetical protein